MTPPRRPVGRRPGLTQTRQAILAAAQTAFTEKGYAEATIRQVAGAAGVDPALVLHYFGSKDGLFEAALRADQPTWGLVELAAEGDVHSLGERFVRHYLGLWENPEQSARMLAVFRAASVSPSAAAMVAALIGEAVMAPLARSIGSPNAELRATLAGSHLFGTSTARYVLHVEPLASLDRDALVGYLGPVIQHYLTGDLDQAQIEAASATTRGR
ncbi:MAG TPA: TetR family transcriptional regulator [Pseudonocardia sp.]|uniref:TetR/AcrR family transcriptional regulator n=1 Tax=Pseudonocardia sp. TaxID=60912 RepID=UPI002C2E81D3|nr:TetR family transcriptional regulator [Pseudonocardia sp.]HTF54376.1 TetR family transcriptional regulator [Pseudonocardia sp.]